MPSPPPTVGVHYGPIQPRPAVRIEPPGPIITPVTKPSRVPTGAVGVVIRSAAAVPRSAGVGTIHVLTENTAKTKD